MPIRCRVILCNHPAVAKELCETHYKRQLRRGSVGLLRPPDWGVRESHPAYKVWCGLRRHHLHDIPAAWRSDFWSFVADVPAKLDGASACRCDSSAPWSKTNFYWREKLPSKESVKRYMREWHQKSRKANPDYYKNSYLKKHYGVTLAWFKETFAAQCGVCAICKRPETAVIKDKAISLAVDHCHETGKVRGLLCRVCNNAIGQLRHDVDILRSAIQYLEK